MNKLPDRPSELIRVGLADLEKCEESPDYSIYMGSWHEPRSKTCVCGYCEAARSEKPNYACMVCLAGAVMAMSLGALPGKRVSPERYDEHSESRLLALDCFRGGDVGAGLCELSLSTDQVAYKRAITPYATNREAFKSDMRQLADDLEKAGL